MPQPAAGAKAQAQIESARAAIASFRALGGGWEPHGPGTAPTATLDEQVHAHRQSIRSSGADVGTPSCHAWTCSVVADHAGFAHQTDAHVCLKGPKCSTTTFQTRLTRERGATAEARSGFSPGPMARGCATTPQALARPWF